MMRSSNPFRPNRHIPRFHAPSDCLTALGFATSRRHVRPPKRHLALLLTASQQRLAKRYEDIQARRYRPVLADTSLIDAELAKTEERRLRLAAALGELRDRVPHLSEDVAKVLAHRRAVADVTAGAQHEAAEAVVTAAAAAQQQAG